MEARVDQASLVISFNERMTNKLPPIRLALSNGREYAIHFRPLIHLADLMSKAGLKRGRCLVITDANVAEHYGKPLRRVLEASGWTPRLHIAPPGETTKSSDELYAIYDVALGWGIDRDTPVLALGGGVVGDLAGFAAASLLRGLPLIQLPTTLIAQVDSAIGGKTGINHAAGKNLIGAFHQPRLVCADTAVLTTLPRREWRSGLAEVLKHALIADSALFDILEQNWDTLLEGTGPASIIHHAASIKVGIVSEDARETGRRTILNFGHTFGHAIERVAGYGRFTHGEAVAGGIRAALFLSHRRYPNVPLERADALARSLSPPDLSELSFTDLLDAMQSDKKVKDGNVRFVILRGLGDAYLCDDLLIDELEAAWEFARTH